MLITNTTYIFVFTFQYQILELLQWFCNLMQFHRINLSYNMQVLLHFFIFSVPQIAVESNYQLRQQTTTQTNITVPEVQYVIPTSPTDCFNNTATTSNILDIDCKIVI